MSLNNSEVNISCEKMNMTTNEEHYCEVESDTSTSGGGSGGGGGSSESAATDGKICVGKETPNDEECPAELKSLRYKIMLMNGNTPPPTEDKHKKNNYDNLQQFLEKEKDNNNKENWSKLNKSLKQKKIMEFVDTYTTANNLSEEEQSKLLEMLKNNMSRGKLTKNKEVNYDRVKGVIKDMPCLVFNKITRNFTIKNMDATKHSTTIKKVSLVRASSSGDTPKNI